MKEMETQTPEGTLYDARLKVEFMLIHRKIRSLKVHLSDEEFNTLHIATTLSPFETQSEFIAATMLATAEDVLNSWHYTTTEPES